MAEGMVQVTVALPQEVYERAAETALKERKAVEEVLSTLVSEGLDSHASARELWERVSTLYRARLAREGKLNQTPEEVLQELRDLRERIANELYP